jgi:hypothetical protein
LERKARRLLREYGAGEPAESEAPGAQINKQINKDIKKTAGKPKFFGFVDSLEDK